MLYLAITLAILSPEVLARSFTVTNNCQYTVWPAIFTDLNVGTSVPAQKTGWEASAGQTVTFDVPNDWQSGRIWGRTDCDFSKPGATACATGSCNGGLECDPHSGTGVPPVTVAEWTLGSGTGPDNYDVSLVDGFNIPMSVVPTKGCHVAECKADINSNCPAALALSGSGGTVGCKSACSANLDGNPTDSANCCSGSHDVPATCPPSGVQYYNIFKGPCPDAYAYAYDESSGTALWTCDTALEADYTVTFCP